MRLKLVTAILVAAIVHATATAQGPACWTSIPTTPTQMVVTAMTTSASGPGGPSYLYAGYSDSSGNVGVTRWDGLSWTLQQPPLPPSQYLTTLGTFDSGVGPELYAGGGAGSGGVGGFISRYVNGSWVAVAGPGTGNAAGCEIHAMVEWDDGGGNALYIGGDDWTCGGPGAGVWRWDGNTWTALGSFSGVVNALAVFDDGTGDALYAAGEFTTVNGTVVNSVARWTGSAWSPLGSGLTLNGVAGIVRTMTVYDDGSGPELWVGGDFWTAGGVGAPGFGRWDGTSWTGVGGVLPVPPEVMTVFDDGSGPKLAVVGLIGAGPGACNARYIALTDGATIANIGYVDSGPGWYAMGNCPGLCCLQIAGLAVFDDGNGPDLVLGGQFGGLSSGLGTTFIGLPGVIVKYDCGNSISLSQTQPGGPGSPVYINNANLTPGNEYFNLFVIGCPAGAGLCSGPYGANWTQTNINLVISQMSQPLGTAPYHVTAPSSYVNWGPFPGLPPLTLDAICIDFTGGVIGPVSPVVRITVQ